MVHLQVAVQTVDSDVGTLPASGVFDSGGKVTGMKWRRQSSCHVAAGKNNLRL